VWVPGKHLLFKRYKNEKASHRLRENIGKTFICQVALSRIYKDLLKLNNKTHYPLKIECFEQILHQRRYR